MPRRGRIQMVGKLVDREVQDRAEATRELERELRREWRPRRTQRRAGDGAVRSLKAKRAARPTGTGYGPAAA